ncbi:prepilin-type N-terminal cleavage/methylation domain-containing protein [Martelella alba]|uniref:Prepilin-type N-terminal cleavage/methylation domain-containing protein n=1 Tax=Martelella alba TaxID=2590451 RepID=A0ABY2SLA9_9HYPH|nr:prepilin-type N-terminal cleavage/methylation domain-containing protein [Martelella alba]TKI05932.1 prepilin-type N-terminal cleavage/methylation domain-containing protein [Martelella alba]
MKKRIFSPQGFSLPEMLLVMLLVSMLALSGGHAWHGYRQHARLAEAARQITDFLARLQWRAVRGNQACRMSFMPDAGTTLAGCCGACVAQTILRPPLTDVRLKIAEPGYIRLLGWHNTATPTHVLVSNPAGSIRIIISGAGRLRLCSEKGRWAAVPPC